MQERRFRGYFDNLADFSHLKRGINVRVLLHVDRNASAYKVLESRLFHINPVLAGEQIHKVVEPVSAAGLCALFLRAQVSQGYLGVCN